MDDVRGFAHVSGDHNPIHVDEQAGKASRFGRCIVHGWFTASLFGTLFAASIPGAVYMAQTIDMHKPVFVGDTVAAKVQVSSVVPRGRGVQVKCVTTCTVQRDGAAIKVISGEGTIYLEAPKAAAL